jgi:hypothetical protein
MIQAQKLLVFVALIFIAFNLPISHELYAQSADEEEATLSGNMTSTNVTEVIGNSTTIPTENITLSGQGNVTISGNITVTDAEGNVIPLEEILFSGDLDFGCRRCH